MKTEDGIVKLKEAVIKDIDDKGTFNANGCNKCVKTCFHPYCDKFKWVLDRAALYAKAFEIPVEAIINKWESQRDYWYMNYYQDSSQPIPEASGKFRIFETIEDLLKSVGNVGFRCPSCNQRSSDAYTCNAGNGCNWKAYGLFHTMGKGVMVFVKSELTMNEIFMPIAWEPNK